MAVSPDNALIVQSDGTVLLETHAPRAEERVPISGERRMEYALADRRSQFRIAAENPAKMARLRRLLERHPGYSYQVVIADAE